MGVSIRELVETLAEVTPFRFEFDPSKPAGFPTRVMEIERAKDRLGYRPSTSLQDGLRETWSWYLANEREFRRRKNYFADAASDARLSA